jgi:hypothetical protein
MSLPGVSPIVSRALEPARLVVQVCQTHHSIRANVLVSYRLRTTGQVRGVAMALPADADPHVVPTSDVIRALADAVGVMPEKIELLDLWTPT